MKTLLLFATLLSGLWVHSTPITRKANKEKSTIAYTANHSLHEWSGETHNVNAVVVLNDGDIIQKVAVSANVADFDSQNASRDSHALEVLEALKYPKVQFTSTGISQQGQLLTVTGNLIFHGITKSVTFEANVANVKKGIVVEGIIPVSLEAFKVERPSFMLIKTDDLIQIKFHLEFYPES